MAPVNPAADELERQAARVMWFSAATMLIGVVVYLLG